MQRILRLGTRGSALALWQARHVARWLRDAWPGLQIDERIITTEGDAQQEQPLGMGDRGVFVNRIEEKLLGGEIDFAVHSLKDLPTTQPDGLSIAAVPERHDPRDALVTREGLGFDELPSGTRVGTGSFRRRTQLLYRRPDLRLEPLRGNVDTRVRHVADGRLGAVVLAVAGLERLGIDQAPHRAIEPEVCLPAVGQGALAIECRADDEEVRTRLASLEHPESRSRVVAERAFLRRLGGGCLAPATAFATIDGEKIDVEAIVGDADGTRLLRESGQAPVGEAAELGVELADRMLARGAGDLLEQVRREDAAG